jgi:uncharacterized protein (TIGR02452 family)
MDFREQNRRVARETRLITEQGFYFKDGERVDLVGENFGEAVVILPDDATKFEKHLPQPSVASFADISITNEDSFSAARKLGGNCLVMNFASATSPGGGFLNGANAQEEALCRESTLYRSLTSEAASEMYGYNNRHKNPCKYNAMIISPNVCVFRDIKDEFLAEPFTTAVVTIPALNKNGGAKNIPQNIVDDVMKFRLRNMFVAAIHYGYKNLVLGAWGCGAFGHDPETVADYFYSLLIDEEFGAYFDKIIFAILDRGAKRNLKAFQSAFDDDSAKMSEFEMIKQQVRNLESAISEFDLSRSAIFHRLADISLLNFFQIVHANDGYFQDEGFTDTSALHIDAPNENFIELEIIVPMGKGRGAYLAPMSAFPEECQFTLNRGTIYKVSEIKQTEAGIWQVIVEVVGRNPKELD